MPHKRCYDSHKHRSVSCGREIHTNLLNFHSPPIGSRQLKANRWQTTTDSGERAPRAKEKSMPGLALQGMRVPLGGCFHAASRLLIRNHVLLDRPRGVRPGCRLLRILLGPSRQGVCSPAATPTASCGTNNLWLISREAPLVVDNLDTCWGILVYGCIADSSATNSFFYAIARAVTRYERS